MKTKKIEIEEYSKIKYLNCIFGTKQNFFLKKCVGFSNKRKNDRDITLISNDFTETSEWILSNLKINNAIQTVLYINQSDYSDKFKRKIKEIDIDIYEFHLSDLIKLFYLYLNYEPLEKIYNEIINNQPKIIVFINDEEEYPDTDLEILSINLFLQNSISQNNTNFISCVDSFLLNNKFLYENINKYQKTGLSFYIITKNLKKLLSKNTKLYWNLFSKIHNYIFYDYIISDIIWFFSRNSAYGFTKKNNIQKFSSNEILFFSNSNNCIFIDIYKKIKEI